MPTEHREAGWTTGHTAPMHRDRRLRRSRTVELVFGTAASRRENQQ